MGKEGLLGKKKWKRWGEKVLGKKEILVVMAKKD